MACTYRVYLDRTVAPPMFGIESTKGIRSRRLSTDYRAVYQLVQQCNIHELSPIHLYDVVEDFCRK